MQETWKYMTQMKDYIVKLLDDDNDGYGRVISSW